MPGLVAVLLLQHNGKALVLLKQGRLNSMYVDGSLLQEMLSAYVTTPEWSLAIVSAILGVNLIVRL
ncbi:hypothetical protein Lpp221_03997 [Lacticaseibacillus paracasei subsp. paracasei Lpp221]|nr:hypothetical protein Lpp221_03997 [Lacticaseibacillus paracasei subsp. paracasei Lpp221]